MVTVTLLNSSLFHFLGLCHIMLHNLRHFRLCIFILTVVALSFGIGDKAELCFTSAGDVHMEQRHPSCSLGGEQQEADMEALALDKDFDVSQGHCLDVSLESDTANHLQRNFVQLFTPALLPLGLPIILTQIEESSFRNTPAVSLPPQLASLLRVVLLI